MREKEMIVSNFAFLKELLLQQMVSIAGLSSEGMLAFNSAMNGDLSKLEYLVTKTKQRVMEMKAIPDSKLEMDRWRDGMSNHLSVLYSNLRCWLGLFRLLFGKVRSKERPNGKKRSRKCA